MTGPASGFETMVEIETDRFKHLKYMEPAFRTEALAVLEEYNKSASNPFLALEEKLRALAFTRKGLESTAYHVDCARRDGVRIAQNLIMTPDSANRHSDTNRGRLGCWPVVIGVGLLCLALIILAVALFWRSMWWKESGAPVPHGTERIQPGPRHTLVRSGVYEAAPMASVWP